MTPTDVGGEGRRGIRLIPILGPKQVLGGIDFCHVGAWGSRHAGSSITSLLEVPLPSGWFSLLNILLQPFPAG